VTESRRIRAEDRAEVHALLLGTAVFQPHEIAVAMELIDVALTRPEQQDYHPYVLVDDGVIVAYACFGKNPMTRSTYDLYWIATKAGQVRQGHGRALFAAVENEIRKREGRLLIIETSSKETYRGTAEFYARIGCELIARVPDFYDEGDDQLIYCKRLR
jgi:ribosomal protein S18 acetylase RimI-like enzyme